MTNTENNEFLTHKINDYRNNIEQDNTDITLTINLSEDSTPPPFAHLKVNPAQDTFVHIPNFDDQLSNNQNRLPPRLPEYEYDDDESPLLGSLAHQCCPRTIESCFLKPFQTSNYEESIEEAKRALLDEEIRKSRNKATKKIEKYNRRKAVTNNREDYFNSKINTIQNGIDNKVLQLCEQYRVKSDLDIMKEKLEYTLAQKQNSRCDDVIILNNTVYIIELKNYNPILPNCKIFSQLLSTRKILEERIYESFDHKVIPEHQENSQYKLILHITREINPIQPAGNNNDEESSFNMFQSIPAIEQFGNIMPCCNKDIIIKYRRNIDLNNL